jgi:hypothetical protein
MPEIIHQDLILYDIPRSIIEQDISVFVGYELDIIRKQYELPTDWPNEKDVRLLVQRSDCLFIYVATVCRFINNREWPPEERLLLIFYNNATDASPTAKLDDMYTQVLKSSVIKNCKGQEKARLNKQFKEIIGSIVTLFNMLSAAALAELLLITVRNIDMALGPLYSVLNILKSRDFSIQLFYPSFRDFLLDSERCPNKDFRIDPEVVYIKLAENCLQLLSNTLTRDICSLGMPGTLIHEIESERIDAHLSKHI